ncbi:MAG: ATP synthase F1 subunit delta [Candidatus Zixiibacteriota bacterium]|jgi:F-type H+-transporting ATPase subunit delta
MRDSVIARRYARALYKLAYREGVVDEVVADFGAFAEVYARDEELRFFLEHPAVPLEGKVDLTGKAVGQEVTRDFLRFLIEKGRLPLTPSINEDLARVYRRDADVVAAEVTSATPLPDDIRQKLSEVLARVTGKRVELKMIVNEDVIGGLKLKIGDHVVDGTLAGRLREFREIMAGAAR